jgi:hypothetical protein
MREEFDRKDAAREQGLALSREVVPATALTPSAPSTAPASGVNAHI